MSFSRNIPLVRCLLSHSNRRALSDKMNPVASSGFSTEADAYENARPTYPQHAVSAMLHVLNVDQQTYAQSNTKSKFQVLDLAAGTGKMTRLLAAQPHLAVTAVEPVA
jgi:2-polyprenyl-3-methyl-5-hydroxy-6-metoxy-1,4-benzoquinol methylase